MGYILLILVIFVGEYFLKQHMDKTLEEDTNKELLGGKIILRKYRNKGAFLNLGEKKSKIVAIISVVFTVALTLVFLVTLTSRGTTALRLGLALLLGGAFSNTYDRLKKKYVMDYVSLNVKHKGLRSVVFNISDFCILIGALILSIRSFF